MVGSVSASASRAFTLRELLVLLFLASLLPISFAQLTQRSREQANRIKCASNLRQIGQAILIYANENRGAFPRTLFDMADEPVPTEYTGANAADPFGPGGPAPNDVTAALFLLLRTGDITPEVFVCPVSDADKLMGDVETRSNFTGRANVTYAYTNPYPSAAARRLKYKLNWTLNSDFAVAADMGRGPDVGMVAANAPRRQMVRANAPFHHGAGQNVLYADGHVEWSPTIFCGAARPIPGAPKDNIYAFGIDSVKTTPSAGIVGAPQDQYDSVILPTADMGPQPSALPPPDPAGWSRQAILVVVGAAVLVGMVAVLLVVIVRSGRPGGPPPPVPSGA